MQNLINMQISSIHSSPLSSLCPSAALMLQTCPCMARCAADVLLVPLQLCAPTGSSVLHAGNQHSMTVKLKTSWKLNPTTLGWCTKCQWWCSTSHSTRIFSIVLCSKSCCQGLRCPSSAVEAWHKTLTQGLPLNAMRKIRAWLAEGFRALVWGFGSGNPVTTTPTGTWGCCISDPITESGEVS